MLRIAKSLLTIVAVGAIATSATGAYFSSTVASPGNTFASGTMILEINDQNPTATAVFNENNLYPGADIGQQIFQVENTGTLSGHHLNLTVTIDNDNDLAKSIVFDAPGNNGLRFGPTMASANSDDMVQEMLLGNLGNDYTFTHANGSPLSNVDSNFDGAISLSELAAAGTIRITPDSNNEGIAAGTTAYLWINASVSSALVTQGETVQATFTWELQQDASQQ